MSEFSDIISSISKSAHPQKLAAPNVYRPAMTVLQNLQSGHGWSKQSTPGTQSDGTSVKKAGTQSLKMVTDGVGGAAFTRKTSISPTINLTGKSILIWVLVSDPTLISEFSLYASSNNLTAYYLWTMASYKAQIQANVWTPITLSFGAATSSGSPDRSAINCFQWRMKDTGAGAITCNLGQIAAFPEPAAGIVSVVFDDNWLSQYTEGFRKMSLYNMPGTMYIMPRSVGAANYATLTQLKEMRDFGWDIACHWETAFTSYTIEQVEKFYIELKNYLAVNGFHRGADHLAYPNGAYNAAIIELTRQYFASARTINETAETLPPADPIKLRTRLITTETPTQVAAFVTEAINNKEWCILTFHKLVTSVTTTTEYLISDFETIIDNLVTSGVSIKTVSDVIANMAKYG